MNIFVTSDCPIECAKHLDDKRVVKMVLETAQLLSTAIDYHGGKVTYKPTHVNHPCSIWARQSIQNFMWLLKHYAALSAEYTRRYGKVHKCDQYWREWSEQISLIPKGNRTPFANCARNKSLGIDYTDFNCVFTAYKLYLNDRWDHDKREPTWGGNAA